MPLRLPLSGAPIVAKVRRLGRTWKERLMQFGAREGSPMREGNTVALYGDGGALIQACRDLVDAARRSVHVEMYIWADDEVGRDLAERLIAAVGRGVVVRVVFDAVGSIGSTDHLDRLREAGATVVDFHPITPWRLRGNVNHRNHRKLLVADDSCAVVGSANWALDYDSARNPSSFRDVGVGVSGHVVADLAQEFRRLWLMATEELLTAQDPIPLRPPGPCFEDVPVQVVSGIKRGDRSVIRRLYGLLIRQARTEILIANAYFVPGRRLLRELTRAAGYGMRVAVVVPGLTDSRFVRAAGRATYTKLLSAGVAIFERQERMIHSKVAVVDGEVAIVGSANLDPRSLVHNLELNVNVRSLQVAAALKAVIQEDLAHSVEIKLETWRKRPFLRKLGQRLAYYVRYWL